MTQRQVNLPKIRSHSLVSARIGRTASAGLPLARASPPHPHSSVPRRSRSVRAPWQCRPYDQSCIVPGTSAPRSTSSRSVTVTVLPFDFTSHQNATASTSFQALLSSRSHPVHHTSRNAVRRSRSATAHALGAPPRFRRSIRQASSPLRAPGVAALRCEAIETVYGAGGKSANFVFEAAAFDCRGLRQHDDGGR